MEAWILPEYSGHSRNKENAMVYLSLIGVIFLFEFFIKELVERYVKLGEKKPFLFGKLFLTKYHNEGAALNFMEKKKSVVAGVSVLLSIVFVGLFLFSMKSNKKEGLKCSLALLLGGAFSNTYDRLKRKYVVDYFGFMNTKGGKQEIIYNLSDFCIIIGAMCSVVFSMEEE